MELFSIRIQRTFQLVSTARMMKIDYCMVDFHIRACLIPSMASFRGCLKKSDMPTCGTEK